MSADWASDFAAAMKQLEEAIAEARADPFLKESDVAHRETRLGRRLRTGIDQDD